MGGGGGGGNLGAGKIGIGSGWLPGPAPEDRSNARSAQQHVGEVKK